MKRLTFAAALYCCAAVLACTAFAQDEQNTGVIEDTHADRGVRGNRHGKGFDEVLKLKGEPLAPRFPRIGEGIARHVLDNGLVVVLAEDRTLPIVEVELSFRCGESYESEEQRGLAAALVDRMRRGGVDGTDSKQLDEAIAALAAQLGGRAGTESTNVTLNALASKFDESFALFSAVVLHPAFNPPPDDAARGGGFGGFGGGRGGRGPAQTVGAEFRRLVYGDDHPLARTGGFGRGGAGPGGSGPGAGADGGRRNDRFTREQIVAAHTTFVRPDRSFLMVVGDFDAPAMLAKIRATFGAWSKPAAAPAPRVERPLSPIAGKAPGVYVIDVPTPQSAIVIGHLGIDRSVEDRFAVELMNDVLGGGSFTSRITERVRSDEGLAYSAGSSYPVDGRHPGTFQASVQTKTESTARAIELILEEIRRIREPGSISTNEFATAREARLYSYALQYTNRARNVARLVQRELEGEPADLDEREFKALQSATIQDLEAAARKYLDPAKLVICVAGDLSQIKDVLAQFGEVHVVPPRGRGGRGRGTDGPAEPGGGR